MALSTDFEAIPLASEGREYVAECIQQWGGAPSIALLDPACEIFQLTEGEGLIGYRIDSKCAIVYGDPVCPPNMIPLLTQEFHRYCQERHLNIIYTVASKQFTDWALKNVCKAAIEFGNELFIDPGMYQKEGIYGRRVRNKISHSMRAGVAVYEYSSYDIQMEQALEQVGQSWLQMRQGPQIYLAHVRLFEERTGKRWFYAKQGDKVVGLALLNQLEAKEGWLLNLLMETPEAPNGTSEHLIDTVIEILKKEGCSFLTFGAIAASQLGKIEGLGAAASLFARLGYKVAHKYLKLAGRLKYWEKFKPSQEPIYVLFGDSRMNFSVIKGVLRAFNISL